ncbi:Programmed cell death protein 5 [Strongyloides ratti]|uniref:Programmed cell death protein 5 n=1 Tax=Strongyloides ratti TaxID=34506 RepID=A0A090LG24_STRRB|nr:Programmed cell death protein 5 [Strongyloides ratti]CEF68687.1 Programmed cell death protein 5 [Strongyloides ratti]
MSGVPNFQPTMGGQAPNHEQIQEQREKQEQMNNTLISQILDKDAMFRLTNLNAANPAKGQQIKQILIQMAQRGQLQEKLDDDKFRNILNSVNNQTEKKETKVNYSRKRNAIDSDSDSD